MIGKKFRWITGGDRGGLSDHYCEGVVLGIVRKKESLFKSWPRKQCKWGNHIVDRSVRYDRAILKNLNHDPSKRSSPVYFIAQLEKLTQPLGPKRKKENHTASMRNHVIEKEERKYLRRPGY